MAASFRSLRNLEIAFANPLTLCKRCFFSGVLDQSVGNFKMLRHPSGRLESWRNLVQSKQTVVPFQQLFVSTSISRHKRFSSSFSSSFVEKFASPLESNQETIRKVNEEMKSNPSRIFAVVAIAGSQFKVTPGDLIQVICHMEADVGERIKFEKVLLVAGDDFTVVGTPLIDQTMVRVEGTVVEKTWEAKKIHFTQIKRKRYSRYKELTSPLTVLRINTIELNPSLS